MASYKSGFDPPTRPSEAGHSKRLGAYMQPGSARLDNMEADYTHSSGQMEPRRGYAPVSRAQQPGFAKTSLRVPSPGTNPIPETKPGVTTSKFGFGKSTAKATATAISTASELRSKSPRNVLRRKPSTLAKHAGQPFPVPKRSESSSPTKWSKLAVENRPSIEASLKAAEAYGDIFTMVTARAYVVNEARPIIPELDRYRTKPEQNAAPNARVTVEVPHKLATQDLPPQTPLLSGTPAHSGISNGHNRYSGYSGSGYSASPSTRFSESPGPGSYSRDTTPTSVSSQSPGVIAPIKTNTPRLRQGSPAHIRPPLTRRMAGTGPLQEGLTIYPHGLQSLRESLNSSSSNSTMKEDGKVQEKKKKQKKPSPLPPNPPPRQSSNNFKTPVSRQEDSPSKVYQAPTKVMIKSSSEMSPLKLRQTAPPSNTKGSPPVRPSREGTPNLHSQLGASMTVIQSNLVGISLSPDKRRSGMPRSAGTSPSHAPFAPEHGSRIPARNPSPSPVQSLEREATPTPSGLGIIPNLKPQQISPYKTLATRTPSPSLTNTKARFGLFGRRTKTTPEVPTVEPRKTLRKGPTAGTGHEGYGRYGIRPRSNSTGTLGSGRDRSMSGASSSQESVGSNLTHDPFLLERLSPVIIAGGGEIVENRNTSSELSRSESNQSLPLDNSRMGSNASSKISFANHEVSRKTLWPSAIGSPQKGRRPSDSSDDAVIKSSSLAIRRSAQRLNNSTGALHPPRPVMTGIISPSVSSLDPSLLSDDSQLGMSPELDRGRPGQLRRPKKLEKRAKSPRKWNFFHRSQPSPKTQVGAPVSVVVGKAPLKAMPHYALLDSSDEQQETEDMDLEAILRDADVVDLSNEELDALQFGHNMEVPRSAEESHPVAAPPLPEARPAPIIFSSPEPMGTSPEIQDMELHRSKATAPARPSRLPQVGRIPKVISARPEATSPKSFSRPFARLSTAQPLLNTAILDHQSLGLGPTPPRPSTPEIHPIGFLPQKDRNDPGSRCDTADSKSETVAMNQHDFLAFSPRKNSEATTSSSGALSFAGTTAVIPEVDSALVEDEVWNEFDDLIDNGGVTKVPASATSSHGVPFQYENYESKCSKNGKVHVEAPSKLPAQPISREPTEGHSPRASEISLSSVYSGEMSARLKDALTAIPTPPTPTTPMSITDFFSGYGDRNNSVLVDSRRRLRQMSQSSSRESTSSSPHSRKLGSEQTAVIEQESSSPISQVNLRVGSMTVSKWLTFGHVLFSPAREDVMQLEGPAKRHSILVIDGLGNDDWSFYAAETYPNSTFYNLSPTRAPPASQRTSISSLISPANHRQVQHLSPSHKFPFPSSMFDVVVFRFPSAMSESSYRNMIAESKRVLKPGGYLEMAILDLDMMNMGNRARRAVRGLKVQIQIADPSISLGSASDTVLRLVGKRGFIDVKSCKVGVPVASTIPSSPDEKKGDTKREEMSLADMMKDESRAGDEGITKMVAKVGRWWYTRCYEMCVMPHGDPSRSIFRDPSLLGECEKWNTSFKLVVAYAQKPIVGRRRTASV